MGGTLGMVGVLVGMSSVGLQGQTVMAQYDFAAFPDASLDTDSLSTAGLFAKVGSWTVAVDSKEGSPASPSIRVRPSDVGSTLNPANYYTFTIATGAAATLDTLSFNVGAQYGGNRSFTIHWQVADSTHPNLGTGSYTVGKKVTWNPVSLALGYAIPAGGGTEFRFYLWATYNGGGSNNPSNDEILLDHVMLEGTHIPEPQAAVLLAGVGLVGFAVRRRRV